MLPSIFSLGVRPPRSVRPLPVGLWNLRSSLTMPGELRFGEVVRLLAEQPDDRDFFLCFDRGWGDSGQPIEWTITWAPKGSASMSLADRLARVGLPAKHLLLWTGIADGVDTYGGFKARCIIGVRKPTAAEVEVADAVEAGWIAGVRWCAQGTAHDEREREEYEGRVRRAARSVRKAGVVETVGGMAGCVGCRRVADSRLRHCPRCGRGRRATCGVGVGDARVAA